VTEQEKKDEELFERGSEESKELLAWKQRAMAFVFEAFGLADVPYDKNKKRTNRIWEILTILQKQAVKLGIKAGRREVKVNARMAAGIYEAQEERWQSKVVELRKKIEYNIQWSENLSGDRDTIGLKIALEEIDKIFGKPAKSSEGVSSSGAKPKSNKATMHGLRSGDAKSKKKKESE